MRVIQLYIYTTLVCESFLTKTVLLSSRVTWGMRSFELYGGACNSLPGVGGSESVLAVCDRIYGLGALHA